MMTLSRFWWSLLNVVIVIQTINCYPEQGKWDVIIQGISGEDKSIVITKSLYKGANFAINVICEPGAAKEDLKLNITWYIRKAACWKEYYETDEPVNYAPHNLFDQLLRQGTPLGNETNYYIQWSEEHPCDDKNYYLSPSKNRLTTESDLIAAQKQFEAKSSVLLEESNLQDTFRVRRETAQNGGHVLLLRDTNPTLPSGSGPVHDNPMYIVEADGIYQLILGTRIVGPSPLSQNASYEAHIHVEIYNDYGYLSAADYPLLIFYGTMCVIYLIYGVGWLIVSFMRWRELLRVQYWVGAVILLGMLEKAVFTAEYESVNKRGMSVPGLIVFAELVSCAKRTLSRMLVIIVSFGFGIVKPRLGVVLHRVVGIGLLYFILASIEGCMRALKPKIPDEGNSKRLVFAIIPLSLLESAICWWVFSALVSTTRTLRLRRNTIKLNLYRHFTNTLVFAVVTSVVFMIWSIRYQNFDSCLSDWKQLWVSDAFWHVLFALILLVIMILWRPTNNNQRFAFSPLLDEGSDGEEETEKLMANVSDTMKLRGTSRGSATPSPRESRSVVRCLSFFHRGDALLWVVAMPQNGRNCLSLRAGMRPLHQLDFADGVYRLPLVLGKESCRHLWRRLASSASSTRSSE